MKNTTRSKNIPFWNFLFALLAVSCGCPITDRTSSVEKLSDRVTDYLAVGSFAEAALACDSIISIDSNNSWAYERKAVALFYLKRYEESKLLSDAAVRLDGNSWEGYFWRGNVRKILGDTSGAIADYSRSIEINPNYALALNNRGNLYGRLNEMDSAVADLKMAIKADSAFVQAWNNLSVYYFRMGYNDSADAIFAQGLKYDKSGLLYQQRGLERYNAKLYELAVADLTLSLQYDSKSALTYLYRAYAYAAMEDHNAACEDLSKARDLGSAEARRYYEANCHKM